jgi:hypothetical protein
MTFNYNSDNANVTKHTRALNAVTDDPSGYLFSVYYTTLTAGVEAHAKV